MSTKTSTPVVIVGGGFTGLAAAYELATRGIKVTVLEADDAIGGLAGSFATPGQRLEKFYHHWFTSDQDINRLTQDLGVEDKVVHRPTLTGKYYANTNYRLTTPLDVLRYKPISFLARLRLGLLVLQARAVKDWRALEGISAAQWIRQKSGNEVYEKVWKPLLIGKFGDVYEEVSAVWFWNKLVLRGGSRGRGGREILAYFEGGFAALADHLASEIERLGGEIHTNCAAQSVMVDADGVATGVAAAAGDFFPGRVLITTALPIAAELLAGVARADYLAELRKVRYLGNTCLTLLLNRSLSDTYWLNVSDPSFPFVGIIEHTNFESQHLYDGNHVVYLSKYLPTDDPLYQLTAEETLQYALPHIQRMFPGFDASWINAFFVHKAEYSQPLVTRYYSKLIPDFHTPVPNVFLCSMAQIYPEDRGTNYAVREGRSAGEYLARTSESHRP